MEESWLPAHQGRLRADGRPCAGTVQSQISHLSTAFSQIGRQGPYLLATGAGNPCDSATVKGYSKGYRMAASRDGHSERAAVPLTAAKLAQLAHYLLGLVASASRPLTRAAYLRDHTLFILLWHTSKRAHDGGKLTFDDLREPDNGSQPFRGLPLPLPAENEPYSSGVVLRIDQLGTKTYRAIRAPPIRLLPGPDASTCAIRALARYLAAVTSLGAPASRYLFRPLDRTQTTFADSPFSTAAIAARLRLHLQTAGLYEGEAAHSFRRGSLQHDAATGATLPDLHARGQIRSPATLQLYLHPTRHEGLRAAGPA